MFVGRTILTLAACLLISHVNSFSPPASSIVGGRGILLLQTRTTSTTTARAQSVNDNVSFHYDQEPRGTSYISQISKQDLHERRQMRRPAQYQQRADRQRRRAALNNRGAGFVVPTQQQQRIVVPPPSMQRQQPMQQQPGFVTTPPIMSQPPPMQQGVPHPQYQYMTNNNYSPLLTNNQSSINNNNNNDDDEFNTFKNNVANSLQSMTNLLREMQQSQSIQSKDVQMLSLKVADMTNRLEKTTNNVNIHSNNQRQGRMNDGDVDYMVDLVSKNFGVSLDGKFNQKITNNANSNNNQRQSRMNDGDVDYLVDIIDKNFGVSLDGKFNQKIKDVIVDNDNEREGLGNNNSSNEDEQKYYPISKVAQLEAKINKIDASIQSIEEKFNVDTFMMNERLDDIEDDISFENGGGMQFNQQVPLPPPPPPEPSFMEQQQRPPPLPPPMPPAFEEEGPPPPPPPLQEGGYDSIYMDDGRTYFQERNYNDPFQQQQQAIPSQQQQQKQQQQQYGNSVNESSTSYHYNNEPNTSFISSFSKVDNERRRQFQPFRRDEQRRYVNGVSVKEQLPRGVRAPPHRRYESIGPPPPPPRQMMMEPMMDEPYNMNMNHMMYEDGPIMMEEEYFYDDMY